MKTGKKGKRQQDGETRRQDEAEKVDKPVVEEARQESAPDGDEEQAAALAREASAVVLEDRLMRLQADFDNFRKRTLREREDLYRRANEDIMLELVPVLDHLELAFLAAGTEGAEHPLVKGFALVGEQLQQVLRKFGLTEVKTDGVDFDPNVHEAIQHIPSAEVPENGLIARTRAGYMLGNRLLRAAQVVVSSGPQGEAAEG